MMPIPFGLMIILGSLSWFLGGLCLGLAVAFARHRHDADVQAEGLHAAGTSAVIHPRLRTTRLSVAPEQDPMAPAAIEALQIEAQRSAR
jgi:hypothetical protein